jgi:hypothetical protein
MWQFIGAAIFLSVLALFIVITFKHLHGLFRLVSGRVPMYRIASVLLVGVVGFAVLSPIMDHMERKSPLHLVGLSLRRKIAFAPVPLPTVC